MIVAMAILDAARYFTRRGRYAYCLLPLIFTIVQQQKKKVEPGI